MFKVNSPVEQAMPDSEAKNEIISEVSFGVISVDNHIHVDY